MLKVDHLDMEYSGVSALRDVSLALAGGEIVSVVGANGGGKTTLLKTISGLLKPL
jgi:branched-chain amino acid transport system ATP-binding protein